MYKYLGRHYASFTLFIYVLKGTPLQQVKWCYSVCYCRAVFSGCLPWLTTGAGWLSRPLLCLRESKPQNPLSILKPSSFLMGSWPFSSPHASPIKMFRPWTWEAVHSCTPGFPAHCRDGWSCWPKPWKQIFNLIFGQAGAYFKSLKTLWISCRPPLPRSKLAAAAQLSFPAAALGKSRGRGDQDPAHCSTVCREDRVASSFVPDFHQRQTLCCFVSLVGI